MASNNRSSGTAAFRYASALVDLAMEQGAIPQIQQDVTDLQAMISSSDDFRALIRSPLIKAGEQQAFLAAIADKAKLSPLMKNFLLTIAQNRRVGGIEAVLKAVQENLAARRGEFSAKVESATALSSAQKKALEENLGQTLGRPVTLDATVNAELIGGVIVTLGSVMIDDSIKTKLDRMARAMKHTGTKAA